MAKKADGKAAEKAPILTAVPEWADAGAIGELVGLSERRIQQLTRSGVLEAEAPPGRKARKYRTCLSPSKNMRASLAAMGYESGQALLESKGLQGALEALKDSVNGDELSSSVEAQTAVLAMAGTQAGNLTSKTAEMYQAAGAADLAFRRQTDTLQYTIQTVKNLGRNFLTQLGTSMLSAWRRRPCRSCKVPWRPPEAMWKSLSSRRRKMPRAGYGKTGRQFWPWPPASERLWRRTARPWACIR